ncbi:MAG: CinA family protein [Kiritimatiellae bacterium]|nr:CinA family protein [Kiritimatiellia bacterium]
MADEIETAAELLSRCRSANLTIGTAESCTGGLIATLITAVPGASDVFRGTVVSYATDVKQSVLQVSAEILDTQGPVCLDCAIAMAKGVRELLKTDWAVSVTGFAGPAGGNENDPVGTVYFGVASSSHSRGCRQIFAGDREEVRIRAAQYALRFLLHEILNRP